MMKNEVGVPEEIPFDNDNQIFQHAVSFVNQTNQLIFLTGKAGTGKTTFLRYIRQHSHKKMAVAAPTGVAAMNAGGMTLHSLFWLPFGLYIAEDTQQLWDGTGSVYDKRRLFSKVKLTARKRTLLQEIELLVIDEVSMVRADVLDAIDTILKSVRRDARPFGGLQVLFIGDLYQLPPVVRDDEWRVMSAYYSSPFFFDAQVLRDHQPVLLELDKIYRQSDPTFISILNAIRNNSCTSVQLGELNSYYQPDFVPPSGESYVTLTSHNRRADEINSKELEALSGTARTYSADVKGDFSESLFPVDTNLKLKVGAQVMFIRNDTGEDRRYFNGKIGSIKHMDSAGKSLLVEFTDGTDAIEVKRETWENIRYDFDNSNDKIKENVLGTFSQFPLRLAWAITIHKSQGLTFEKAIIDAGSSFAAGQVYVALSRMTSMQGLVLKTKIPAHSIRTDVAVMEFSRMTQTADQLPATLAESQRQYLGHILLESFRWDRLTTLSSKILSDLEERNIPKQADAHRQLSAMKSAVQGQAEVAGKFRGQLQALLRSGTSADYPKIMERTSKAIGWFGPQIDEGLILFLEKHRDEWAELKRTKRYVADLQDAIEEFKRKREQLNQCLEIAENLAKNVSS